MSWESGDSETMRGVFQLYSPAADVAHLEATGAAGLLAAEPLDGPTGLESEVSGFQTEGRTFGDLIAHLHGLFACLEVSLGFPRSKVQNSGGIFPLPDTHDGLVEMVGEISGEVSRILLGLCQSLNSYYGVGASAAPVVSAARKRAVEAIRAYATDFGWSAEKFEGVSWERFMHVRGVDYRGEEVKLARKFAWGNILPALPDGIGSIPLLEVCEGGTLHFVANFENYLLPEDCHVYTKPPRIFVDPGDWETVCQGLLSKGVCRWIGESEVYKVCGKPLLNGLFAVSK